MSHFAHEEFVRARRTLWQAAVGSGGLTLIVNAAVSQNLSGVEQGGVVAGSAVLAAAASLARNEAAKLGAVVSAWLKRRKVPLSLDYGDVPVVGEPAGSAAVPASAPAEAPVRDPYASPGPVGS